MTPTVGNLTRLASRLGHVRVRDAVQGPVKAAAIAAFTVGLILFLVNPPSLDGLEGLLVLIGGGCVLVLFAAWATLALMGREGPTEAEFDRIIERSEALAKQPPPDTPPSEFDEMVVQALDALPPEFREVLARVPVVVSHRGQEHRAYGHYYGDTAARDNYPDKIIVYQDTLERDFGHDPELLRAQVERVVRHEVAHHLGWNERGVRNLGL